MEGTERAPRGAAGEWPTTWPLSQFLVEERAPQPELKSEKSKVKSAAFGSLDTMTGRRIVESPSSFYSENLIAVANARREDSHAHELRISLHGL